ncbi:hypothetical protein AVEN_65180-1 [Araneus ventricosus]|uniref:Reverse transcriptase domain-containing protein n=1 Tax=Araneus ventricosus TaxID=182803 RepID=A0A4Y2AH93_ARAVE|nr:hypothetical protein AVEN_65180-1 [Araneus ventricosus]
MRSEFKPRTITCRNKRGELVSEPHVVLGVWKDYFQDLLEGRDETDAPQDDPVEQDFIKDEGNPPPSINEVDEPVLVDALHKILVKIWESEKLPTEWEVGFICPLFKKGDQLECRNYRGITLLNTAYKIFSNLLFARLQPHIERVIGNYQCGFRPQRSTVDQIHTLRQILEKTKEYNIKTFHRFIDFKAAYDSIKRDKLIKAMIEFNIPTKLVNLTKASLSNVRCRVKIQNYLSESFTAERGLRQVDSLACLLFNLALEKCIRVSGLDRRDTLWNRSLQLLTYEDDIDIIGRSERAVKEAFRALEISATDMGLTINEDKTRFMEVPSSTGNYTPFRINGHTFERVSEFKYLGTSINDQNMLKAEINNRIKSANKCFFGLIKKN